MKPIPSRDSSPSQATKLIRAQPWVWIGATVLCLAAQFIAVGVLASPLGQLHTIHPALAIISVLAAISVSGALFFGLSFLAVRQLRGLPLNTWEPIRFLLRPGAPINTVALVLLLAIAGLPFLILPGFFLLGIHAFAPLISLDKKVGPMEALAESRRMLRQSWVTSSVAVLLGVLLFGVIGSCCALAVPILIPILAATVAVEYENLRTAPALSDGIG